MLKVCSKCGNEKELMSGVWRCRLCRKAYNKEYLRRYRQRPEFAAQERKYQRKYLSKLDVQKRRRKYYDSNDVKLHNRERRRKYVATRRKNNTNFRILCNLRSRIWRALKGIDKSFNTEKLIGMPIHIFRDYIAVQFRSGMSWLNYGKVWHIDHIKPISLFDLNDHEQQKEAFCYLNCQPLFAHENLAKGNKYCKI